MTSLYHKPLSKYLLLSKFANRFHIHLLKFPSAVQKNLYVCVYAGAYACVRDKYKLAQSQGGVYIKLTVCLLNAVLWAGIMSLKSLHFVFANPVLLHCVCL